MPRRPIAAVAVTAFVVAAVALATAAGPAATGSAGAAPAGKAAEPSSFALELVAAVDDATALAVRPGDDALYVATQPGLVLAVRDGVEPQTVLDLTSLLRSGGERGLLGLAFSPDGTHLYVHYTGRASGETVLEEYQLTDAGIDPRTRRVVLTVPQPQPNHNGGQLAFGPDGLLYVALGDGGGSGDRGSGHHPEGNGQNLDTLLGKILRIDPKPSGGMPYTIPSANPFANDGGRGEIFVYGLRNPWRFSFDRKSGALWIADVGESTSEEVTRLTATEAPGANLGWNLYEGTEQFREGPDADVVMPQIVTSHDDGNCAMTGGYVYRGRALPELRGWYLYTDYCNGVIRAARINGKGVLKERAVGLSAKSVSSFGQDRDGELYVLSQDEGVFRIVAA